MHAEVLDKLTRHVKTIEFDLKLDLVERLQTFSCNLQREFKPA